MSDVLNLLRDSVVAPRRAAGEVLGWSLPLPRILEGVALVAALGGLVLGLLGGGQAMVPTMEGELVLSPIGYALILAVILVLSAGAITLAGRLLGGHGGFEAALAVVVWLQIVDLAIQAVQAIVFLLVPPLAAIAAIVGLIILIWCLFNFVQVLHGFTGVWQTLLALGLSAIGLGFALSIVLAVFGIGATSGV